MTRKLPFVVLLLVVLLSFARPTFAQSATTSGTATPSGTATSSGTATGSGTVTTLPQTGAHDVLILFAAGVIFLVAGITALNGAKQVFADFE
ncbi:MAG: hypothetical protein BroJett025_09010 [Patescibacteria group bacterium]|nr:MAG: hypothetical protein BroJett025_09010 [Patescibacteria group bacterium]